MTVTNTVAPTMNNATSGLNPATVGDLFAIGSNGSWTDSTGGTLSFTYQWQNSSDSVTFVNIVGATGPTYSTQAGDTSKWVAINVTATSSNTGSAAHITNNIFVISATAPVNTVPPVVTGTPQQGSTLTTTNGTWTGSPSPTFANKWYTNTGVISGATSSTYAPVSGDVGKTIFSSIIATNSNSSVIANSAPTAVVAGPVPTLNISQGGSFGDLNIGSGSTTSGGGLGNMRGRKFTSNLTGQVSTLTVNMGGMSSTDIIRGIVYSHNAIANGPENLLGYSANTSVNSGTTGNVAVSLSLHPAPVVSGTDYWIVFQQNSGTITYRMASTFPFITATPGNFAAVPQNFTGGSSSGSAPGFLATAVADLSNAPVISGTTTVGQTLTVSDGNYDGTPIGRYYQWFNNAVSIPGATANTYTLPDAAGDHIITANVVAYNVFGNSAAYTATANSSITPLAPTNTVLPVISGNLFTGNTMTSTTGTFTGGGNMTFAYQWANALGNISGATSSTFYTLDRNAGDNLYVSVKATNGSGTTTANSTTSAIAQGLKTIFITNATGSNFTFPADYNGTGIINGIGHGGIGNYNATSARHGGGGGGAFGNATITAYTAGQTVNINVPLGGAGTGTWFDTSSTFFIDFGRNGATAATTGGSGGLSGNCLGTSVAFSGGNGGTSGSTTGSGGGGGSAGPGGAGKNGGNGGTTGSGGGGGSNGGSSTAGTNASTTVATTGGQGPLGTGAGAANNNATAGSGAGGGGVNSATTNIGNSASFPAFIQSSDGATAGPSGGSGGSSVNNTNGSTPPAYGGGTGGRAVVTFQPVPGAALLVLQYQPAAAGVISFALLPGNIQIQGQPLTLVAQTTNVTFALLPGNVTITGKPITISSTLSLSINPAAVKITGQQIGVSSTLSLGLTAGNIAIHGQQLSLTANLKTGGKHAYRNLVFRGGNLRYR